VGLFRRIRSRFKELHAQSPVDVIHAHGALPCGRAAALLSGEFKIPYVVTVHGLDAFSSRQVSGWPGAWCEKASRRVYAGARRVIGVSARVCEEVKRNMGGLSAAVVIHNGVDPLRFTPGEDPEQPTVLTVGNLIPTKGHELMVYALKALLPEFPQLTWEVIGDGTERTRIRLLAERLGVLQNIRFRGRQDRDAVGQAFRRCTVFALPSCYEALGCVYLEAMACGKASVGCEGQGVAEIIRHGDSGWLVPPNGREELVAALRVLLANEMLRRQIGARGRETVMNSFTLEHQAKRLVKIFEESKG
jgi:glycosyltransferase involved in cell wall biosynthesis